MSDSMPTPARSRRAFIGYFASIGLSTTLLPGILWAQTARGEEITSETVAKAAELAGLEFDDDERAMMVAALTQQEKQIETIHGIALTNDVVPAVHFNPVLPGMAVEKGAHKIVRSAVSSKAVPASHAELAFLPVTELSELLRRRKVTSEQLTRLSLDRLQEFDPTLHCVITLTADRALEHAKAADEELRRGHWRGPLHGVPWGAKDLLAAKGYPTTWGSTPFKTQMFDTDATVVQRLDAAGAVLVAKLSLGELAMGDVWFGGMTRNPWKPEQGSSGSSAGPACATAAGLVGFSIGTETLGSISSPSTRCGVTGLRPTFGRVPRTGAMALSWTMDKIGPICRSAEDCALVLDAIHGSDGHDPTSVDAAFPFDGRSAPSSLRVGYIKSAFDQDHPTKTFDDAALDALGALGVTLVPVELPDHPWGAISIVLRAEGAAAFDDLTRSGRDKLMAQQGANAWPNEFRVARFIPAVEYVNAMRARTLAMRALDQALANVDVVVTPTFGPQLVATNLTGHPAVIVPNGFRDDGTPVSLTFLGRLFGEAPALQLASAYQKRTGFHLKHPDWLMKD
ncbi:MAG TPA: amidase family protein [Gemmatimonadaceae bacterium]|nr:amidase family protein [Gemmatimonadaceae bacterium]